MGVLHGTRRISLADDRDFLEWREGSGATIEIYDIQIGSERGVGRGRRLVETLFASNPGKFIWAITRADNWIGQQFYERLRFRVVGVLRGFYGGEGVAVMYGRSSDGPV